MTKLAPEWVRTDDPVIRSPERYRWTTAPASDHGKGIYMSWLFIWFYLVYLFNKIYTVFMISNLKNKICINGTYKIYHSRLYAKCTMGIFQR